MIDRSNTPLSLKVILAYLAVVVLLRLGGMVVGGFSILGAAFCVTVAIIGAGMYLRYRAAYYVLFVVLTVAMYGTVVYVVIAAANSHGRVLTDIPFLIGVALTLIPVAILYRLMGDEEVRAQYRRVPAAGSEQAQRSSEA
ncbi:MAG TPA: hypothetical protein VKA50_12765 [Gammaproteobacteria bacterium]|nr:hypothetical protein [Gammaproteobacteria bacterium]